MRPASELPPATTNRFGGSTGTRFGLSIESEPLSQLQPSPPLSRSLDGDRQRLPLPDENDEALAPRHARVDQVSLQHRVVLVLRGITTAGYSEPWLLWMVVA